MPAEICKIVGYVYVDDTDLLHTAADPHAPIKDEFAHFQNALDHWAGLLGVTEGGN